MNHQSLIAAGFEQVASDAQEGVVFRKRTRAEDLSYVNEHIVEYPAHRINQDSIPD